MNTSLTTAQLVALAGCVKPAALTDAKKALPENSTETVDFNVRIHGSVQKGASLVATTSTERPRVCLTSISAVCAVLRQLGIGPKRLRTALEALPPADHIKSDEDLAKVFAIVEEAKAASLEPVAVTIAGKAATVTSQVSAIKL